MVKDMFSARPVIRCALVASLGVVLLGAGAPWAHGADPARFARSSKVEIGARYWVNWGETSKDLYDTNGRALVSRLTYHDLSGDAHEIFGRFTRNGYFVRAFFGLGHLGSGRLRDEDFPPAVSVYSSTDSGQHSGSIGYATLDLGHDLRQWENSRVGVFFGYNYFKQDVTGYGCTQRATHPGVCVPSVAVATRVITQRNHWRSLRIGMNGEMHRGRWRLSGDVALMPRVSLRGTDSHWRRICGEAGCFTGAIPEDGQGHGYQLEAMLSYQVSRKVRLGIGGRYWHMQTRGYTHFEGHIAGDGGSPQRVDWYTDIFGLTAQVSARF